VLRPPLEAVERAAAAERARDRAAQDAAAATREQLRADGRATALADRLTRAEDLAEAAAAQAGELRDQVAALTATLRARDTTLDEERAQRRGLVEDHRTELAARDTVLAARRTEHQAELDQLRRDTADAQHQTAAEHARQLAELHRQLGAADHQIEALRALGRRPRRYGRGVTRFDTMPELANRRHAARIRGRMRPTPGRRRRTGPGCCRRATSSRGCRTP
jgi:chromosome segregation ATPase